VKFMKHFNGHASCRSLGASAVKSELLTVLVNELQRHMQLQTTQIMKLTGFWDVVRCSFLETDWHFTGP
jgi:hypothetical protein